MSKQELTAENLAKSLVPVLSRMGQERRSVVLNVFSNGWTVGHDVRRNTKAIGLTSAANYSHAFKVASRLLASLDY